MYYFTDRVLSVPYLRMQIIINNFIAVMNFVLVIRIISYLRLSNSDI